MIFVYSLLLIGFSLYSYALIDPNLTFFSNDYWVIFRNFFVDLGYNHRDISSYIFISGIILLFLFYYLLLNKFKKINPFKLGLLIGFITLLSYPFLSHDFFNYIFDAKIFTYYHQNPYSMRPQDFPDDLWLRFMHWTHRTYPYGPTFLLISFIPSLLAVGKFILNFIFFKAMFVFFYLIAIRALMKKDKKIALMFTVSPLVIVEGLISSHNDLVGLSLAIVGIIYLEKNKSLLGRFFLLLSAGVKYITLPLLLNSKKNLMLHYLSVIFLLILLGYLSFFSEIQPWYFLSLFAFLPIFPGLIMKLQIFFAGLLFSYYPYIWLGGWDTAEEINLKHNIILVFLVINVIYMIIKYKIASAKSKLNVGKSCF